MSGHLRQKPQSSCDLLSDVMAYHFCYVLFNRSESNSSVYIPREGIVKGCAHKEAGITREHFRS